MQLRYYPDTDILYIAFLEVTSVESDEVSPGVVVDFDGAGNAVGIEIEDASRRADLSSLQGFSLPKVRFQRHPAAEPGSAARVRDVSRVTGPDWTLEDWSPAAEEFALRDGDRVFVRQLPDRSRTPSSPG